MLDELQRIAEGLASRLHRSVAIDDPQVQLLVHTAHHDEAVDRFRMASIMQRKFSLDGVGREQLEQYGISKSIKPVRIPADPAIEMISRVCVPIRCQGFLFGYLWLLDPDESLSDEDLDLAMESANSAGEKLFRVQMLGDLDKAREREMLGDLLSSDIRVRTAAADQLVVAELLPSGAQVAVLAVHLEQAGSNAVSTQIGVALRNASRRLAPWQSVSAVRGGTSGVLLVGGRRLPNPPHLQEIGEWLYQELLDLGAGVDARVGIGPVVASIAQALGSYQCAQDAMRVASSVPGSDAVTSWNSLGIYRLLVQLPLDQLRESAIPAGLLRLIETDTSGVMLETLETYLDQAGNVPASVEKLNIHRTSLYYRLRRIEESTEMSLSNGSDRLALHLGTKLVRLTGISPAKSDR